ncbi:hypothetical protein ACIQAA_10330 [Neobacillus sp. NPDC093182]|uniref:hypothetical protein n=1 Tax=Neobacillus sp. NPDC093182 TaxID=3364297 RepID=UPI0037FA8D74
MKEDGLLWRCCYPKKSSSIYKGKDCSREPNRDILSEEGFELVQQITIDGDWSVLRFQQPDQIK